MSTREVILDGGSPWGFRMHGGADVGQPLRISRVNPGSKAAQKGVREGDVISSINGQSTRSISNSDAHALLRNAGQTLHLGLNEECSGSPKRRVYKNVQESRTESIKRSSSINSSTSTSSSAVFKTSASVNGGAGHKSASANGPLTGDTSRRDGHNQNGSVTSLPSSSTTNSTSTPDSKGRRCRPPQTAESTANAKATPTDVGNGRDVGVEETARQHSNSLASNPRTGRHAGQPQQSKSISDPTDAVASAMDGVAGPETEDGGGQSGSARSRRRRRSRANRRKCRSVGSTATAASGEGGRDDASPPADGRREETVSESDAGAGDRASPQPGEESAAWTVQNSIHRTRTVAKEQKTQHVVTITFSGCNGTAGTQENADPASSRTRNDIRPIEIVAVETTATSSNTGRSSGNTEMKTQALEEKTSASVLSSKRTNGRDAIETEAGHSISNGNEMLSEDLEEDELYEVEVECNPSLEQVTTYQERYVETVYKVNSEECRSTCDELDTRTVKHDSSVSEQVTVHGELEGTKNTQREDVILTSNTGNVNEESKVSVGDKSTTVEIEPKSIDPVSPMDICESVDDYNEARGVGNASADKAEMRMGGIARESVHSVVQEAVIVTNLRNQCTFTTLTDMCRGSTFDANETPGVRIPSSAVERSDNSAESRNEEECSNSGERAQPRLPPRECTAAVVDDSDEEVWEECEELVISEYDSSTDDPSQLEDEDLDGKPDAQCVLTANTTALNQNAETTEGDMRQSFGDEELLVPIPAMPAEEEASLRLFLQSLNLSAAPDAPQFGRCVSLEDQIVVEDVPLKRGKKRAAPEVFFDPYQQQRCLDVILEETSDHSDSERKNQEASETEEQQNGAVVDYGVRKRAWEDVVFNPETNEIIVISDCQERINGESSAFELQKDESGKRGVKNSDETCFENDSFVGSETRSVAQGEERIEAAPEMEEKQEILTSAVIISETKSFVTISDENTHSVRKVHEQKSWFKGKSPLWRPSVIISEADSGAASGEDSGGDQRVELAESSDDAVVERDTSRRHGGVEIVILEDDGSRVTSPPDGSGVSWLRMAQECDSDVQVVHDAGGDLASDRDVTLRRGVAQERERAVEVVFLEDDSSGSSVVAPQDDGENDADAEEEADPRENAVRFISLGKLGNDSYAARQRKSFIESTTSSEGSIIREDELLDETPTIDTFFNQEVAPTVEEKQHTTSAEITQSRDRKNTISSHLTSVVTSTSDAGEFGNAPGCKTDFSLPESTVTSSDTAANEGQKDAFDGKPENIRETRKEGKCIQDQLLADLEMCISGDAFPLKENGLEVGSHKEQPPALSPSRKDPFLSEHVGTRSSAPLDATGVCTDGDSGSATGGDTNRRRRSDPQEGPIPLSVAEHGRSAEDLSPPRATGGAEVTDGGVRHGTASDDGNAAGATDEYAVNTGRETASHTTDGTLDSSVNTSVVRHERNVTEINTSVTKTTCHVNFSRGAAFCYIDIPSQVERRGPNTLVGNSDKDPSLNGLREIKSEKNGERRNQNKGLRSEMDNTPLPSENLTLVSSLSREETSDELGHTDKILGNHEHIQTDVNEKAVGDTNNFEFIKRLLTVMPEQDMSDKTIYSLLSQLTIAQVSALSPSLKRNIDALLTVSCRDAQSPCAAPNNTDAAPVRGTDPPENDASELVDDDDEATPPQHSRHGSSSSDATSHNTALYNPSLSRASSEADVSASDAFLDTAPSGDPTPEVYRRMWRNPRTLKEISVEAVIALPYGVDILRELGLQFMENLNVKNSHDSTCNIPVPPVRKSRINIRELMNASPSLERNSVSTEASISRNLFMGSLPDLHAADGGSVPASPTASPLPPPLPPPPQCDWLGLQTPDDPRLLLCLSPAQRRSYHGGEEPTPEDAGCLLDLHCKFLGRRGYHEQLSPFSTPPQRPPTPGRHGSLRSSPSVANYSAGSNPRGLASPQPHSPSPSGSLSPSEHRVHLSPRHHRLIQQQRSVGEPPANQRAPRGARPHETSRPAGRGCAGGASPPTRPKSTALTSSDAKILVASSDGRESGESSSRLLAILRAASASPTGGATHSQPGTRPHEMLKFARERQPRAVSWCDGGQEDRLRAHQLADWMQLARGASRSPSPAPHPERRGHKASAAMPADRRHPAPDWAKKQEEKFKLLTEKLSTMARELEEKRDMHSQNIKRRSLPHSLSEKFERQIQASLQNRPRSPQQTVDQHRFEDEVFVRSSSFSEQESRQRRFDADKYVISRQGDVAVIQSDPQHSGRPRLLRPKSMCEAVASGGELFRQQMYDEYMDRVAERAERRRQKIIRISTLPDDGAPHTPESVTSPTRARSVPAEGADNGAAHRLESEFMGKVRERMDKLGLKYDEDSDGNPDVSASEVRAAPEEAAGYVIEAGGGSAAMRQLPKHLQEFLVLTADTEADGVWTPTQKAAVLPEDKPRSQRPEPQQAARGEEDAALPPVWTPHSAGASPTAERKEFRPVSFDSPTLARKNRSPAPAVSKPEEPKPTSTPTTPQLSADAPSVPPPWQRDDSAVQAVHSAAAAASRLVQSQSAPASGLSVLAGGGATKLPRAQNPTITLLQKAREGQLPRGALYLDHKMSSKENDKPLVGQNEILYTIKKEYQKETESGQTKKIAELGPRKFEGIGPTTREGIPIVLRSEIKDANQAKWYKRMYDSLHRAEKDDDYVTIRYKPRRGHYPYTSAGGYLSEPEPAGYDSDIGYSAKYATLDRRRIKNKENDFTTSTLPRSKYVPHPASIKYATEVYKNQPGRIEDYEPGHSSISDKEAKQWWDEVLDIFDGQAATEQQTTPPTPSSKPFMTYALKESGYESDSTLVFKRRDETLQSQLSPAEQKLAYKTIQKGGEVPLHGLRKPAPERPKEPEIGPQPPAKGRPLFPREGASESPHRYVESEVTIHYRSPVRAEAKEVLSEEELARRQAEAMRRIYQEERRRKYLQELQDMHSRRHTDNFTPSQKSPIPLNRYDDFLDDIGSKSKSRDRTPEPKLVARALYNFVGQTSRELSFRRGDIIFVRRQIDKNWYEGEHNAMIGLFPFNYVEIIPYDGIRTIPKRPSEGQARAKFNFIAQTHLELSLVKGEMIVLTRRVDGNWFEGRIGSRKGIFPVSYVEILSEPGDRAGTPATPSTKPASHSVLVNGSGVKQQHLYQSQQTPSSYYSQTKQGTSYTSSNPYATLPRQGQTAKQSLAPVNQTLHIDTHSEPVPYRALYNYRPQNEDELELCEGDTVYVMEKCDDGWYVGSSQRSGYFGTFPGNYVERL